MSSLCVPVEQLSQLRVSIRVLKSGGFAISFEPHTGGQPTFGQICPPSPYTVQIEAVEDHQGHVLQVCSFPNRTALPGSSTQTAQADSLTAQPAPMPSEQRTYANTSVGSSINALAGPSTPIASMALWMHPDFPISSQTGGQVADGSSAVFVDSSHPTLGPSSTSTPSTPSDSESETSLASGRRKRTYSCPKCPRRFTSEYTLKVHLRAHTPKQTKAIPCMMGCQEHFSRQHDRLRHEVTKHGRVCEWVCEQCRKFFSSKRTLSNHNCRTSGGFTRWEI
ncbi:uncharacterized protein B0H18DRAFT_951784 [Fomitopsis serialis]|uniref:uncharacterized protein n=1 Tax=Fomitopsis serialis TaxID=139415 RepID=UPI00200856FA|nr:uncharacterized protein B0H18DRAFT_951784 [Neoantrodia serialis]KAH9933803.1 hypothetical protein B0H18DRAFT_951784 [Neoantrodia serialis]